MRNKTALCVHVYCLAVNSTEALWDLNVDWQLHAGKRKHVKGDKNVMEIWAYVSTGLFDLKLYKDYHHRKLVWVQILSLLLRMKLWRQQIVIYVESVVVTGFTAEAWDNIRNTGRPLDRSTFIGKASHENKHKLYNAWKLKSFFRPPRKVWRLIVQIKEHGHWTHDEFPGGKGRRGRQWLIIILNAI